MPCRKNNPNTLKPPSTSRRHQLRTALFFKLIFRERNIDLLSHAFIVCFLHMPWHDRPATLVHVDEAPTQLNHLARARARVTALAAHTESVVSGHLQPEFVFLLMLSIYQWGTKCRHSLAKPRCLVILSDWTLFSYHWFIWKVNSGPQTKICVSFCQCTKNSNPSFTFTLSLRGVSHFPCL